MMIPHVQQRSVRNWTIIRLKKKKRYFYQKTWGSNWDKQFIPAETNTSPENTCIEGFFPKTESKRKHKSISYCCCSTFFNHTTLMLKRASSLWNPLSGQVHCSFGTRCEKQPAKLQDTEQSFPSDLQLLPGLHCSFSRDWTQNPTFCPQGKL